MAPKKTKTQEKSKTEFNIEDTEKQKKSEISIRGEEGTETVNQTFPSGKPSDNSRTWWFIELWEDRREIFKNLAFHIIFTFIGLLFLFLVHTLIEKSTLPQDEKELLQKMDFYIMVIVLGFFGIEFIFKMAVIIIKDIKDGR